MALLIHSEGQKETSEERAWSDLPIEIITEIATHLTCADYPYFASVCKSWSRINQLVFPIDRAPLLLYYQIIPRKGVCHFYSSCANKTFKVDCPVDITDYEFYCARDGWLLLCHNRNCLFVNPFTGVSHEFPGCGHRKCTYMNYIFSGCPPHDFKIYAFDCLWDKRIYITSYDGEKWQKEMEFVNNLPFILSPLSNPVICGSLIYCLSKSGNLGIYDSLRQGTWTVVNGREKFDVSCLDSCMVESRGELFSVQIAKYGALLQIFRFDQVNKAWDTVESLGDQSLFVGSKTSIMMTPLEKEMRNKVYNSRFHGTLQTAELEYANGKLYLHHNC